MSYISLGKDCSVAYQLREYRRRTQSYPLDWLSTSSIPLITYLINTKFKDFFSSIDDPTLFSFYKLSSSHPKIEEEEGEVRDKDNNKDNNKDISRIFRLTIKIDSTYTIDFSHDFYVNSSSSSSFNEDPSVLSLTLIEKEEFIDKYQRRVDRFFSCLKEEEEIVFIRIEDGKSFKKNYPYYPQLISLLNSPSLKKYSFYSRRLVIILHSSQGSLSSSFPFSSPPLFSSPHQLLTYQVSFEDWKRGVLPWEEIFNRIEVENIYKYPLYLPSSTIKEKGYRNKVVIHPDQQLEDCISDTSKIIIKEVKNYLTTSFPPSIYNSLLNVIVREGCSLKDVLVALEWRVSFPSCINKAEQEEVEDKLINYLSSSFASINKDYITPQIILGGRVITFIVTPYSFFQINNDTLIPLYDTILNLIYLSIPPSSLPSASIISLGDDSGNVVSALSPFISQIKGYLTGLPSYKAYQNSPIFNSLVLVDKQGKDKDKDYSFLSSLDVLITNPGRNGHKKEVLNRIIGNTSRPSNIIYMSCRLSSLDREVPLFLPFYNIKQITPIPTFIGLEDYYHQIVLLTRIPAPS